MPSFAHSSTHLCIHSASSNFSSPLFCSSFLFRRCSTTCDNEYQNLHLIHIKLGQKASQLNIKPEAMTPPLLNAAGQCCHVMQIILQLYCNSTVRTRLAWIKSATGLLALACTGMHLEVIVFATACTGMQSEAKTWCC